MNWKFEWITNWETIYSESFQKQWLLWVNKAQNSHIFFHPKLSMAWIESYSQIWHIAPHFCIATFNGNLIFFPLVKITKNYKSFFHQILAPIGISSFDYLDPLIVGEEKNLLISFFNELISEIKSIKSDITYFSGLHQSLNFPGLILKGKEQCYYTNLENFKNSAEELLNDMKPKNRREHQRVERRLLELGEISFECIYDNKLNLLSDELNLFKKHYRQRWPNAFFAPGFHDKVVFNGIENELVRFSQLKLENISIGWAIDLKWKDRYYAYMHTYDINYVSYAPGRMHLMERIKLAFKEKYAHFDLLTGSETYKSEWFNNCEIIHNYQLNSINFGPAIRNKLNQIKSKIKSYHG